MKKVLAIPFLCSLIYANELHILNEDKKELRKVEKQILNERYKTLKNEWISTIDLSSSLSRSHSFSDENDKLTKSISIGFSQSIYKSGGIDFTIKYANDKLESDLLSWENDNRDLLITIYQVVLEIAKIDLEVQQGRYQLENADIEVILKKIQYEAGDIDITELNDAIMTKNAQIKTLINLKNSLKEQEIELSKYTDIKYQEIELFDFNKIDKQNYLKNNIEIMYEDSLVKLQKTSYEKLKTTYLPSIDISTSLSHSDSDDLTENTSSDSQSGSIGLSLTIPLFDITKKSTLEESRLTALKEKITLNDLKRELSMNFDGAITRIDTYEKYNQTIEENIKLYDDLINVNEASSGAGMSSIYDLEILKNTKKINQYDLKINDINIQQEYANLYFKIKAN